MNKGLAEITVEVACGDSDRQRLVRLTMPVGATARDAVLAADLAAEFPDLDSAAAPLAIFGAEVADSYQLQSGDRVDMLRPLQRDPRDARRELAARGKTIAARPAGDKA